MGRGLHVGRPSVVRWLRSVAVGQVSVAMGQVSVAVGPPWVTVGRGFHVGRVPWAGHNRWSKVRNVKGPRDAARSRQFQRLSFLLRAAAREGGPDPALNTPLANVMEQCRAKNMPKASIEAAIRSADKSSAATTRLLLEARGPGGAAILVEVLTDNPRRTHQDVRVVLSRNGGTLADGARHGFEEKGVVRVAARDQRGRPVALEEALEAALEAGAQDVSTDEDEEEEEEEEPALKFLCDPPALHQVRSRLEAAGLRPLSAAVEFLPRDRVPLPEETWAAAQRLLQALADCPDVVRLFHNIQPDSGGA